MIREMVMEAVGISETSINFYETARFNMAKGSHLRRKIK
jgi:hypothetical protein